MGLAAAVLALAGPPAASADRFVYVSHGFQGGGSNNVSTLRINADGSLSAVGAPVPTGGTVTNGIAITPDAGNVYVANFGTSNVTGYLVGANGGLASLGAPFGTGFSNPLGVAPDPDGGHLFAWNHGGAPATAVSTIAANGGLSNIGGSPFATPATQNSPFAGSVAPDGDHLYVPMENSTETVAGCGLTCEINRVTSYTVAANGAVAALQAPGVVTGTTNVTAGGPNPFGSTITPDGRFLYVSNPEDGLNGTISGFAVAANGTLSAQLFPPLNVAPGNHPLAMVVSPDSRHLYVATRISNTVNAYTINVNGTLTPIPGQPFATDGTNGRSLALTPDGERLYVANSDTDNVSGFTVAANGALTLDAAGPWLTGGNEPGLESMVITPNQAPTAAFNSVAGFAGKPTTFNGTISSDPDSNAVARYDWGFGDGSSLPNGGPAPQHTYASPGTYPVTLTVTDDEGCSTQRIFSGKATLCNGSGAARTTGQLTISAEPAAATPTRTTRRCKKGFKLKKVKVKVKGKKKKKKRKRCVKKKKKKKKKKRR